MLKIVVCILQLNLCTHGVANQVNVEEPRVKLSERPVERLKDFEKRVDERIAELKSKKSKVQ